MKQIIHFQGNPTLVSGKLPKPGDTAPDFTLIGTDLSDITLNSFTGKRKVLNIFPSIDTGVCATSVRKFNQLASELENTVVLCISSDLPFAQSRFCGTEGLSNVITLSTLRSGDFKQAYGVEIVQGPLATLTARAILVLNEHNKILHSQLVDEITTEPNYDAALTALK